MARKITHEYSLLNIHRNLNTHINELFVLEKQIEIKMWVHMINLAVVESYTVCTTGLHYI